MDMPTSSISTGNIPTRKLRSEEQELLNVLLSGQYETDEISAMLKDIKAQDMRDGGMGSVRFVDPERPNRKMGDVIAEADYVDIDGVLVKISVNTDETSQLFEIDFWKVDFSPLKRYPHPADLREPGGPFSRRSIAKGHSR